MYRYQPQNKLLNQSHLLHTFSSAPTQPLSALPAPTQPVTSSAYIGRAVAFPITASASIPRPTIAAITTGNTSPWQSAVDRRNSSTTTDGQWDAPQASTGYAAGVGPGRLKPLAQNHPNMLAAIIADLESMATVGPIPSDIPAATAGIQQAHPLVPSGHTMLATLITLEPGALQPQPPPANGRPRYARLGAPFWTVDDANPPPVI